MSNTMEQAKRKRTIVGNSAGIKPLADKNMFSREMYNQKNTRTEPVYAKSLASDKGGAGVRDTMTGMGLDNSKIKWEDGYVTYEGNKFKPSYVKDGVSYAPKDDIQKFVRTIYNSKDINPVRVTDYQAPAGMEGYSYSENGEVFFGGEKVPVLYIDGDRAVADSNELDRIYETVMDRAGIKTSDELYKDWNDDYKEELDDAYGSVKNHGDWEYNIENDPAYNAYSQMYQREGERAYKDAAARFASKNNGNMTSAAQSLANQQLDYYLDKLSDKIPELQKNAYERYKGDFDMKKDSYTMLREQADADWEKRNEVNERLKDDYKKGHTNERERTAFALDEEEKRLEIEESKQRKNQESMNNAWNNADRRGYFTEGEGSLLNIQRKPDGSYMTPNDIKIKNDVQYFIEVEFPNLTKEEKLKLETKLIELEEKYQNDMKLAGYRASVK